MSALKRSMYAPRKKKDMGAVDPSLPPIPKELLDQLFTGPMAAEAVEAVMRQFKKAFLERALGADGRCALTCRVTVVVPSSRSSSASTNAASPALTTRSSACMHVA